MRVIIQRSLTSQVSIAGQVIGAIDRGLVLLVGFTDDDGPEDLDYCARKISNLRIFSDQEGKMNLDIKQAGGDILSISQFTLYGNTAKGNRPSYVHAARPDYASDLYDLFNEKLRELGHRVETGEFGGDMLVDIQNDGPVTILLDSKYKNV